MISINAKVQGKTRATLLPNGLHKRGTVLGFRLNEKRKTVFRIMWDGEQNSAEYAKNAFLIIGNSANSRSAAPINVPPPQTGAQEPMEVDIMNGIDEDNESGEDTDSE
jgi:hypothetical protein